MHKKHITGVSSKILGAVLAALVLIKPSARATQSVGFSSQSFRGKISSNVMASLWDSNPLFNMLIQSSGDAWGYDVVQGTTMFAAADGSGNPSQSGWHEHPTAITIGLVVQGTLWNQMKDNPGCLIAYPTGTVFFEGRGKIHNAWNLDPNTPVVVQVIHFIDRGVAATRLDQPDPVTGDPNIASPAPPACPADMPSRTDAPRQ